MAAFFLNIQTISAELLIQTQTKIITMVNQNNPLLEKWQTPFNTPPFNIIEPSHFKEAIDEAIKDAESEIELITCNTDVPSFENTIVALERAGELLGKISAMLFNLNSAETSKEIQLAAQDASSAITRFSNKITLNPILFERIKTLFENKETLGLNSEQTELLEQKHRNFVLGGAGLAEDKKKRFMEITEELSTLGLKFDENLLEETNAWTLHITDEESLGGLPETLVEMAAAEAKSRNLEGWTFTLHVPSYVPFMQFAEKRELREKMLKAYTSRSFNGNKFDNREIVKRIVNLRTELAQILGFENYAELTLGDRMADSPDKVNNFLNDLYNASESGAKRDFENVKSYAQKLGHTAPVERWDWPYYSEKLRKSLYDIDDEILRPWFKLESVENAIFNLATTLFDVSFRQNSAIPVYHPEVKTYEVYDSDGAFLSILYIDYHPRPGKSGGAWMTSYRDQKIVDGVDIRPFISIVANFTRVTETKPSLLSHNEITTFLHEFGHALHGMLTKCNYESLSGTNVARDFVELPSQFMENYAFEETWLQSWAIHYETGEKLPVHYIKKIKEASVFNEGYAMFRQLGFGFLDMEWHTLTSPIDVDVAQFEDSAMSKIELFPKVSGTNISCSFAHIFGGGYAAGYYGYKWAEVLDADAFECFSEKGIFDAQTAASFRRNILESGASCKPMELYIKFRGKKPSIEPLLKRSGLI